MGILALSSHHIHTLLLAILRDGWMDGLNWIGTHTIFNKREMYVEKTNNLSTIPPPFIYSYNFVRVCYTRCSVSKELLPHSNRYSMFCTSNFILYKKARNLII